MRLEVWRERRLDGETTLVDFIGFIENPDDLAEVAKPHGWGKFKVTTPYGEVAAEFRVPRPRREEAVHG